MKSYEEITNDLLERRGKYVIEQNRKKKRMIGVTTSLCCCCLVSFICFGFWQKEQEDNQPPVTLNDSIIIGEKDYINPDELEINGNTDTVSNNEIRVIEIDVLPTIRVKMFIALMKDDFISMNTDEINKYYGVNIFPTVPSDLKNKDDQSFGIYKRKANGEVYYDGNKIQYTNEDFSRSIAVYVDSNSLPFDFSNWFEIIESRSIVNDVEVGIARTKIGEMYAEFIYESVGFQIYASGLAQDEFVAVIESILK